MSFLVGYASKHGATGEIAERIAEILTLAGRHAEARPVQQAGDLGGYEGFVVGSAAYSTHWLKDATAFVMSNRDLLAHRPVWLFSTGPLGTDVADGKGVDLRTTAEPKEIPGFREAIGSRDCLSRDGKQGWQAGPVGRQTKAWIGCPVITGQRATADWK